MTPAARKRLVGLSMRFNPFVTAVLGSPVHWLLSPGLMLITVTGRRSGRRYTIPVGYHQLDDCIVVLVAEARSKQWWRNFRTPGDVELRLRGKLLRATARALAPESADFKHYAEASFRRARMVPAIFGIEFNRRSGLTPQQVAKLGAEAAIVKITPEPEK
jgi:deazaflavin-dependent oxidoreductase (nitroreductase family)